MTVTEIVDELRATRPRAGDALRLQVLTLASSPPMRERSLLDRIRGRRLALLVPAAAGLAVVSAVAIGVTRPEPTRDAASAPATEGRYSAERRVRMVLVALPVRRRRRRRRPHRPCRGRAQRYVASLTLAVEDTDAPAATQRH
jgi:hypothetical protein